VVGIDSLLQSFKGRNVVLENSSKVPYLKDMVRRKMDRLLSGRGKQDVSPHSDRYRNTNGNDLRHDCRYVTPVRSKRSTLPTECYQSSLTQRSSTLVNKDSRDDNDNTFKEDTTDSRDDDNNTFLENTTDDDDSTFKDDTSDDERNYEDSQFEKTPLPIDDYVEYNGNNDIYSSKSADKMKASVYGNCK
jgi:hypothetical protein